jgi:diguanylate cyclase (GGDEF)-like protein/PAS domain S-box-containing protein
MNLAALLIPPLLDAKQALRLRRFGLAALTYSLSMGLVSLAWAFGVLSESAALDVGFLFILVNVGLYAAIRSGFNLRFKDPSLTRFQMLVAITLLMVLVYHMHDSRNSALFGCFVIFQFGIFRLNSRDFTVLTLYTLAGYALVINLLMYLRPEAIPSVSREWLSWLLLAGFLPIFTIVGGHINALRRRVRASEARFRALAEMSADQYWESDAEHRLARGSPDRRPNNYANFQHCAQYGDLIWEIPSLSPDETGWQAHRALRDAHASFRDFEYSRIGTDGSERTISVSGDPIFDGAGVFQGYRGVGTDITDRKRSEQILRESAEKLGLIAHYVPALIAYWDENQRCDFASKPFAEFYGFTVGNIIGRHAREVLGDAAYERTKSHIEQVRQGHPVAYERIMTMPTGESRHIEASLRPHVGKGGKFMGWFAMTTDVTEHKLAEQRMHQIAHHDSLTGLPNRLMFDDRLAYTISLAKRDAQQFALLYLDLDKFKPVNDALGHAAGDEVLKAVAARIRGQIRGSDTVARVGGDEFTVILPAIKGREEAETVANKITAALGLPFQLGSLREIVDVGASIGVAIYPVDGLDADALVAAADAAMYGAKQAGV